VLLVHGEVFSTTDIAPPDASIIFPAPDEAWSPQHVGCRKDGDGCKEEEIATRLMKEEQQLLDNPIIPVVVASGDSSP
jgi:hypothetical protein